MGDLDRQQAIERAAGGCLAIVVPLIVATIALAALAWSSVAVPIMAVTLILSGVGLIVVEWAVRGSHAP